MRLEYLQYVLEVARTGSISAAAKNLWMGQTTLSAAIGAAEKELGIELFVRTSRGVRLTPKGEEALPLISRMMNDYQQLITVANNPITKNESCNIGCYPAFSARLGSYLTQQKERRFHEVSLNIIPILTRKIVPSIADGKCEIGIGTIAEPVLENIRYSAARQGISFEILSMDYFCAIVNPRSRHWGKRSINIQELREDQFVSMSYSPQFTDSFPVTDWKSFQQQSVLGDVEAVKQAVATSDCVAITPYLSVLDDIYTKNGLIWPARITGFDTNILNFVAYLPQVEQSVVGSAMLRKIRAFYKELDAYKAEVERTHWGAAAEEKKCTAWTIRCCAAFAVKGQNRAPCRKRKRRRPQYAGGVFGVIA